MPASLKCGRGAGIEPTPNLQSGLQCTSVPWFQRQPRMTGPGQLLSTELQRPRLRSVIPMDHGTPTAFSSLSFALSRPHWMRYLARLLTRACHRPRRPRPQLLVPRAGLDTGSLSPKRPCRRTVLSRFSSPMTSDPTGHNHYCQATDVNTIANKINQNNMKHLLSWDRGLARHSGPLRCFKAPEVNDSLLVCIN